MREFFKKGYLFLYECFENVDKSLEESYKGAVIEQVRPELRFKLLAHICEGDFFSLYPTCIAAFNISHETIITSDHLSTINRASPVKHKSVDMCYQSVTDI